MAGAVEGFAEPYCQIEVSASGEPGLITDVRVREGDSVKKGDILLALDTDVLEAALRIARRRSEFTGRLRAAEAEHKLRSERAAKLRTLRDQGHASAAEIERAEADLAVAEAQVVLANEERELAALECARIEAQIERRRFRSPIDGVVVEVFRDVGEAAEISDPRLLTLVQLNPLRVKFPVTVLQSAGLSAGDTIRVELPEFATATDAHVEIVAPVLDAKSGTVQVTCVINNDQGQYRSGMRCLLQLADSFHKLPQHIESQ
jgi:RND family efflux transporter MFP subunit